MSRAKSGLGSVKRDFSDAPMSSQGSEALPWDPTPPKYPSSQPTLSVSTATTDASNPKETPRERRLREIQNALSNRTTPALAQPTKRPSDPDLAEATQPTKKARKLPPGYLSDDEYDAPKRTSSSARAKVVHTAPPPPKRKGGKIQLSEEQQQILALVEQGQSVFYTGSAGTGKSVLLREIIKTLKKKHSRSHDAVAMTASTGIAACNIGGVTIHSFAGIGLGIEEAEKLADKIRKNKKAMTRWQRTKVLIIDEVSMLDGDLFDKLCRIGCILRRNTEPFGGIQLIVTGDFFQLPPVSKSGAVKFAFEALKWKEAIPRTFNLTQVFRQSDQEFIDMLNEMRFGRLSQKSIDKFRSLSREIRYEDGLGPTELFPRREDVANSNTTRMKHLDSKIHVFTSSDGGTVVEPQQRDRLLSNFMAEQRLELREGAQVMLIKNMDESLVNGSMGRVIKFSDPAKALQEDVDILGETANGLGKKPMSTAPAGKGILYPVVEFQLASGGKATMMVKPESFKVELPTGEVQASRTQLPLILAWALSIHKSQGQTLERVKVDLGRVFEKGQAYVALSRATSLEGLQVLRFDPSKVMAHPKVVEWSKTLESAIASSSGSGVASGSKMDEDEEDYW
ncbi:ATP-dependent DNA helicase PIF1 [Mycena chlorophos]|uniref:ATP-dependent DNA helicase PIF1 n=1 Tax=Mycena chlorophos TaxID=658473 RepID=A0A8H6T2J5_MYCCL|nr:ATP-dependent DNA helicase PIF1 [Mycena chlorophos]